MMPLETYLRARRSAPYHVQVELVEAPRELPELGHVRISARVVRVFRGSSRLRAGDGVAFELSVCNRGAHAPPGGTWWTPAEKLAKARFMEVFLEGALPTCQVSLWQSQIVEVPSRRPQMGLWKLEPGWRDSLRFLDRLRFLKSKPAGV